jgi:GT2 family glycosyltransferase
MGVQSDGLSEVGDQAPPRAGSTAAGTITVIVPVLNALATLPACLDSVLAAMKRAGVRDLVVVDNGSRDGSYELVRTRYAEHARLLRQPGIRVGQVRNVGAAGATTDVLAFIDSDCVVGVDYFTTMQRVFTEPSVAATGATYSLPDQPGWIERTWDALHAAPPRGPVAWINAGNFAIRRTVFEQLGAFDGTLSSGEDTQIGARLRNEGFMLYEEPLLRCVHLGNPKSIGHFFRKHVWHGMGILGTPGARDRVRRPLAMLVAHFLLTAGGVGILFATGIPIVARLACLVFCVLGVPLFSVVYRIRQSRRHCNFGSALFLYFVYYTARLVALGKLAGESLRSAPRVDSGL